MLARIAVDNNGTRRTERLSLTDASVAFALDSRGEQLPVITPTSIRLVTGDGTVMYHGLAEKVTELRRRVHLRHAA